MRIRPKGPVGHCSAKLRRLLQIDEEQALRWKVKSTWKWEESKERRGGRWVTRPCFDVVGPFSSRPVSTLGHVSFHFSHEAVAKGVGGRSVLLSASGRNSLAASTPAEHDNYVSRPDAVLTVSAAEFDDYAVRPAAVDLPDGTHRAILSNISLDPKERREFWQSVFDHEREARPDCLVFHRRHLSAAQWRTLGDAESLPMEVRTIAEQMSSLPAAKSKRKGDAQLVMDRVQAKEILARARELLGDWKSDRCPFRLVKGRAGRVQYRITAEFPVGLSATDRLEILKEFCEALDEGGVMYTAAIHAPDEHNDRRNHHLHIAYYDRPCARMPDGRWDFEVSEKVEGQHNR